MATATKTKATKKAPVKKVAAEKATSPAGRVSLKEYNPYDKDLTPKHYKIANILLTKKTVSYDEIFEAAGEGGASPRTIGYVKASLALCGIEVESHRDSERGTVYRTAATGRLKHVKVDGTGAPTKGEDDTSAPLGTAKKAPAKSTAKKSPGGSKTTKPKVAKKTVAKKAPAKKVASKPTKKAGPKAKFAGNKRRRS